ncbi:MAG: hypothetical protein AAGC92_14255 [Pseudomonadota bacterium]
MSISKITTSELLQLSQASGRGDLRALQRSLRFLADPANRVQEMTESGPVRAGVEALELNHASVAIAATIGKAADHAGQTFLVVNTSASGTAAHTVTLTEGTFDGINNIVTLNAPGETLMVHFTKDGAGTILLNSGSVLS